MAFHGALKELGYRIGGSLIGVGSIAGIAFLGHSLNIEFLQSSGGIFISAIVLVEILFFSALAYAAVTGKL